MRMLKIAVVSLAVLAGVGSAHAEDKDKHFNLDQFLQEVEVGNGH